MPKKEKKCPFAYYYQTFSIGFVGYDSAEINYMLLERYDTGSDYSRLASIDTLFNPEIIQLGDTIMHYRDSNYRYNVGFLK